MTQLLCENEMIGALVALIGVGIFTYGIAMLSDWHRLGTRWAKAGIEFRQRLYRRPNLHETANLPRLAAFGGFLAVVIGLGWTIAGIGLATGRLH